MSEVKDIKVAYGLTVPGSQPYEVHRISMEVVVTPGKKEKTETVFEQSFGMIQDLVLEKALIIAEDDDD